MIISEIGPISTNKLFKDHMKIIQLFRSNIYVIKYFIKLMPRNVFLFCVPDKRMSIKIEKKRIYF